MATFRARFASRYDILLVFGVCVFPVHVWGILNALGRLPAWILSSDVWDLAGIVAYTQVFALAESGLVLLILIALSALLPGRYLKDRFVAQATMLVAVSTLWAVFMHYREQILTPESMAALRLIFAGWLTSIAVGYILVRRFGRLEHMVTAAADRLLTLSLLYVGLDLIGLVIVIFRNFQGMA